MTDATPVSGTSAPRHQLAAKIRSAITRGVLAPGQVLPSLDDFAAEYGVGRTTAQHALKQLADEGWLLRRRRAGTVVNPDRAAKLQYVAVLTRPLLLLQGSPYNCVAIPAVARLLHQAQLRFRFFHGIMLEEKSGLSEHLVEPDLMNAIERGEVRGLIVVGHIPDRAEPLMRRILDLDLPIVECGQAASGQLRCPVVMFDYFRLAQRLVECVRRDGARRIATLTGPITPAHDIHRAVASIKAMHRAVLPAALQMSTDSYTPAQSFAVTRAMLQGRQPPDAIVVFDDVLALGVDKAVSNLQPKQPPLLATQTNLGARLPYRQHWHEVPFDPWEQMATALRLLQRLLAREPVPRTVERLQPVDAQTADALEQQRNTRGILVLPLGQTQGRGVRFSSPAGAAARAPARPGRKRSP